MVTQSFLFLNELQSICKYQELYPFEYTQLLVQYNFHPTYIWEPCINGIFTKNNLLNELRNGCLET